MMFYVKKVLYKLSETAVLIIFLQQILIIKKYS